MKVVSFGGGTNSTAMLCGFKERGIIPDAIIFADTGGEMPSTYEHILEMDAQCRVWWGVGITTVRATYKGEFESLEDSCLRKSILPSLAYGSKACSMKHKVAPQQKEIIARARNLKFLIIENYIGYDAGESHRKISKTEEKIAKGVTSKYLYPLIEWNWRRADCVAAIKRHGLTQPGKSSCFFCPAMKRGEILRLKDEHPDLFQRALRIEANAQTEKNMGLTGRSLRWADIAAQDEAQGKLWDFLDRNDESPIPCGCYDG